MASLFSGFTSSKSLTDLDMSLNTTFGVDGVRNMVPFLENSPNLSSIDFCGNRNFNSECFEVLVQVLQKTRVRTLNFENCIITDISALVTYKLSSLQKLNFDGTKIGREGCVSLSSILKCAASTLKYLNLNNNDIGNEGAEILAASLKHNTKLRTLNLRQNNITMDGYIALLKLLNDISSIENTYKSNHTLIALKLVYHNTKSGVIGLIDSLIDINNRNQTSRHAAGRAKVIHYQLNSRNRKYVCRLLGVAYTEGNNMLADIEPKLLGTALALIGNKHGQSEFYKSLLPVAPDLMSFIDRKAMIENEKGRNAVHTTNLEAEHERKMAALNAEYEQKLAVLTAKDNDLSSRLALIESGDRKHQQSVVDVGKEGGEKRQRIN